MKHLRKFADIDIQTIKDNVDSILLDIKDKNDNSAITYQTRLEGGRTHAGQDLYITFSPSGREVEFEFTDTLYECLKTIEDLLRANNLGVVYNYEYFDPEKHDNFIKSCYRIDEIKGKEFLFMFIHLNSYK